MGLAARFSDTVRMLGVVVAMQESTVLEGLTHLGNRYFNVFETKPRERT